MRRRRLKWLWARLKQLSAMTLKREELLMKLGAARAKATVAWRLIDIKVAAGGAGVSGILCARPVSLLNLETLAEDHGELGLGLEPFARRSFPVFARLVENKI